MASKIDTDPRILPREGSPLIPDRKGGSLLILKGKELELHLMEMTLNVRCHLCSGDILCYIFLTQTSSHGLFCLDLGLPRSVSDKE